MKSVAHPGTPVNAIAASPLVRALRGERPQRLPVWFMRQAGRSLPEYRAARAGTAMLDACLTPALAAEITCQPVRRHGVDAAVFFSDIVVPVRLAGVGVQIVPGVGPVLDEPIRTARQVNALPDIDPQALEPVREAARLAVAELGDTPLVGFAGAPFTVASYLVEGRPSRELPTMRALLREDRPTWDALLGWVARTSTAFLRAQVEAGAAAVQLFDSWVGALGEADYRAAVLPHSAAVLHAVGALGVPRIHFGTRTRHLLAALHEAGADAVGVDPQTPLDEAVCALGGGVPVQGNIDPELLGAPWPVLERHVRDVVRRGALAPGHVVNLGHGVPPDTDPDVLTRIVGLVHSLGDGRPRHGDPMPTTERAP